MNRYQRQKSKEIKQIMKRDKFGTMTYNEAKRLWKMCRYWVWCKPCKDCNRYICNELVK